MPARPPDVPAQPPPARISASGGPGQPPARAGWAVLGIFCAAVIAYFPALHGGLVWDDDGHITRPALRSLHGLWLIWSDPHATQQYYPLLHSAFWIEHRLWADRTFGYHLTNVLLHAANACLFGLVLRRLAVPGAWLAAFIFVLHPVCVESVAWMAEQKNTLSLAFYLGAAAIYLQFDEKRRPWQYGAAFFLFACGLLTKTVTATLPAGLLVIFWWRRGNLSWRRDVLPLLPWFACGAAGGLFTAWVERKLIGAEGAGFELTLLQRVLLAGRVIWFYLGSLAWPARLTFIYPHWKIDPAAGWQWLPLAGMLAVTALLWLVRKRTRAPLAAWLFFCGSLFPVLGFFNVFPFIYSYVADHFQYLPDLGLLALAAAGLTLAAKRLSTATRAAAVALAVLGLAGLGAMAWQQSGFYRDSGTLYRATIARNPDCWLAYNNLGVELADHGGNVDEAMACFRRALQAKPDYAEAHYNLGKALAQLNRLPEAIARFHEALRYRPDHADTYDNLGIALYREGRPVEAAEQFQRALEINPAHVHAHNNLGLALAALGRLPEAMEQYEEALQLDPENAEACDNLGIALARSGRLPEAVKYYEQSLQLNSGNANAHTNLGIALAALGRLSQAMQHYEEALRLRPDYPEVYLNMGNALLQMNRTGEAIESYEKTLQLKPNFAEARFDLGIALAQAGRMPEAATQFQEVLRQNPNDTQARAWLARLQAYPATGPLK